MLYPEQKKPTQKDHNIRVCVLPILCCRMMYRLVHVATKCCCRLEHPIQPRFLVYRGNLEELTTEGFMTGPGNVCPVDSYMNNQPTLRSV
jgi:hypothetical protein